MLIVTAYYLCKEDKRDEVLEYCQENIRETRKEPGNISYMHYPDPENDNGVFVLEKWENETLFDKHDKTEHHRKFSALRRPLLQPNSYEITIYNAEPNDRENDRVHEFVKNHIN
jgi:quinol monooxygenase YgiN